MIKWCNKCGRYQISQESSPGVRLCEYCGVSESMVECFWRTKSPFRNSVETILIVISRMAYAAESQESQSTDDSALCHDYRMLRRLNDDLITLANNLDARIDMENVKKHDNH